MSKRRTRVWARTNRPNVRQKAWDPPPVWFDPPPVIPTGDRPRDPCIDSPTTIPTFDPRGHGEPDVITTPGSPRYQNIPTGETKAFSFQSETYSADAAPGAQPQYFETPGTDGRVPLVLGAPIFAVRKGFGSLRGPCIQQGTQAVDIVGVIGAATEDVVWFGLPAALGFGLLDWPTGLWRASITIVTGSNLASTYNLQATIHRVTAGGANRGFLTLNTVSFVGGLGNPILAEYTGTSVAATFNADAARAVTDNLLLRFVLVGIAFPAQLLETVTVRFNRASELLRTPF